MKGAKVELLNPAEWGGRERERVCVSEDWAGLSRVANFPSAGQVLRSPHGP
jgi:hypothetical protein